MGSSMADEKRIETAALIVAAGDSERFGEDKLYKALPDGMSPLEKCVKTFCAHPEVDKVKVVVARNNRAAWQKIARIYMKTGKLTAECEGGASRGESVKNGVRAFVSRLPRFILVHDGARPFVSMRLISTVIEALKRGEKAVAPALAVTDTLKRAVGGAVRATVSREELFATQTPQGFAFTTLLDALKQSRNHTDEAGAVEAAGGRPLLLEGEVHNIKLTHRRDWQLAAALCLQPPFEPRSGYGFDAHRLVGGKAMTLGGVRIVGKHMLAGHSDADVACHALTDAILGALALGDIGSHFPSDNPRWKNANSLDFLSFAVDKVAEYDGKIINVDITLVCESPRIAPLRAQMVKKLGQVLGIEPSRISIKATTTEGMGFTGRAEGIAAHALASLLLPPQRDGGDATSVS